MLLKIRYAFKYVLGCDFQWLFLQIRDLVMMCQEFLKNSGLLVPLLLLFQSVALYIFSFISSVSLSLSLSLVNSWDFGPEERQQDVLIPYLGAIPWNPLSRESESHNGCSPEDNQIPCLERISRARYPFCKWGYRGSGRDVTPLRKCS